MNFNIKIIGTLIYFLHIGCSEYCISFVHNFSDLIDHHKRTFIFLITIQNAKGNLTHFLLLKYSSIYSSGQCITICEIYMI